MTVEKLGRRSRARIGLLEFEMMLSDFNSIPSSRRAENLRSVINIMAMTGFQIGAMVAHRISYFGLQQPMIIQGVRIEENKNLPVGTVEVLDTNGRITHFLVYKKETGWVVKDAPKNVFLARA